MAPEGLLKGDREPRRLTIAPRTARLRCRLWLCGGEAYVCRFW